MEKVMLFSVGGYGDAVFAIDMCSSVHLVSQYCEFFLSVAHVIRNTAGEFGSFPHTRASEEQRSFCLTERSYFSLCRVFSNAVYSRVRRR